METARLSARTPRAARWRPATTAVLLSVVIAGGFGAIWYPLPAIAASALLVALAVLGPDLGVRLPLLFAPVIGVVLAGYAFLGRGFAHLGAPPIYVGEIALSLGLAALIASGGVGRALRAPGAWLLLALAAWGAVGTVPYIGRYGLESLRDASLWVYAAFALVIAGLAGDAALRGAVLAYRRHFPWFLAAFPLLAVLFIGFEGWIPVVPGTHGITLLFLKFGDVGVHLAGAGAFLALGLYDRLSERRVPGASWIIWTFFAISTAVVASLSRSGLVSIVAALGIVFIAKPLGAHWRLAPLGLIGVLLLFALGQTGFSSRLEREVSLSQVSANVMSIFDSSSQTNQLGDNVRWRLRWWRRIADDTAFGARRFTGRGYGVNLAKVDGFLGDSDLDQKLRSPHSVHMTFLARGGLPGLGLWAAFIAIFAGMQIAASRQASRCGHDVLARVVLFLLAYWVAFLVNASFDVFLEGPQGGIWFWCLTGLAMATIATVRRETRPDATPY